MADTKSYEQLLASATTIKENELPESNTNTLVGGHEVDVVNKLKEEHGNIVQVEVNRQKTASDALRSGLETRNLNGYSSDNIMIDIGTGNGIDFISIPGNNMSYYLPVIPLSYYQISGDEGVYTKILFYKDKDPSTFISGINVPSDTGQNVPAFTFRVPEGANYVLTYVAINNMFDSTDSFKIVRLGDYSISTIKQNINRSLSFDYAKEYIDQNYIVGTQGVNENGTLFTGDRSNAYIEKLPLPKGHKFTLKKTDGTLIRNLIFVWKSDGTTLSRTIGEYDITDPATQYTTGIEFTLLDDEGYVSFFYRYPTLNAYPSDSLTDAPALTLRINDFTDADLRPYSGVNPSSGEIIPSTSDSVLSGYVPVAPDTNYMLYNKRGVYVRNIVCFYDANKAYLGYQGVVSGNLLTGKIDFKTPQNCAFIAFFTKYWVDATDDIALTLSNDGALTVGNMRIPVSGSKYKPYTPIVRFSYNLNTVNPLSVASNSVDTVLDTDNSSTDWAVLMLPANYDPNGEPVPLVLGIHGGGGTVTSSGSQTEGFPLYQYLVTKGYAVMDVGGMPQSYAQENQVDWYRVMGCYFAVNSYERAYRYIIDNYNVAKDGVLMTGGSNGGLTSNNIYAHSAIPIKCMAGMSPLVSFDNAWRIPTGAISGGKFGAYQNRANIIAIYGMAPVNTQEELNAATIEYDKIVGFDPMKYNVVKDENGNLCKIHTVPYKIWHPIDDPVVEIDRSREMVQMIKNAGGYAVLREMATGGHAPESAGAIVGYFTYNGSSIPIYPAMEELRLWFDRFR